jgi:hypothetical protein
MLKKILGEDIKESPEEFKEWLGALSKEQLIAKMMRKKVSGLIPHFLFLRRLLCFTFHEGSPSSSFVGLGVKTILLQFNCLTL